LLLPSPRPRRPGRRCSVDRLPDAGAQV